MLTMSMSSAKELQQSTSDFLSPSTERRPLEGSSYLKQATEVLLLIDRI